MTAFILQKYRDLGTILTDSFVYLREHYKSLGKALLFYVLPFYLISGMLVGETYSGFVDALLDNPALWEDSVNTTKLFSGLLLMLFSSAVLFTVTLKHISLAQQSDSGEVDISNILDDALPLFLSVVGLYLLLIFVVGFSFMLFVIPGIYVGIRFFVSPAVLILEDRNPMEALIRSWQLTKGYWWFTFGVYLVMNIVTSVMSYVLTMPLSIAIEFVTASGANVTSGLAGTGVQLLYGLLMVISSLFTVIMLIAMCLHYFNLLERKEGHGLQSKIEGLD